VSAVTAGATAQRLRVARRMQEQLAAAIERTTDPTRLLRLAEFAGSFMWNSHGGSFALPHVEIALRDRFRAPPPVAPGGEIPSGRTLHVLTEALEVGGHTKLAKRWIELSDDEEHAVVLTRQVSDMDAAWLRPDGRDVPILDVSRSGKAPDLDKVARLIGLFRDARRVVLHIHPDDAVTVAAAHRVPDADIRFVNHADHVGWLGAALPMTLLNLRQVGKRLAATYRGIPESTSDVLPLPITPLAPPDRESARRELGIEDGEVVLLTIATGYKFLPSGNRSLQPALDAVLGRPEVRLIAIGPSPDHPVFRYLAERHPGRVQALGVIPKPDLHRAAADVYLDSYPFCSPTSMLESASLGTPVLSFQPDFDELGILYSECPGLERASYAAETAERYAELLHALVDDPTHRLAVAESIRTGMTVHRPDSWRDALRRHLQTRATPAAWSGAGTEPRSGLLNHVLAGIGRDPRKRPKLKRWFVLGPTGPVRAAWARMGG
jgi:glycosyltransferase involved in cell wall biosynthesis